MPEYKLISTEEVLKKMQENRERGDRAMIEGAMAALREGPMPIQFDPGRPFCLQLRHKPKDALSDQGWCVHPWRFPDVFSAGRAAKDLRKLDSRLEIRIAKASGQ